MVGKSIDMNQFGGFGNASISMETAPSPLPKNYFYKIHFNHSGRQDYSFHYSENIKKIRLLMGGKLVYEGVPVPKYTGKKLPLEIDVQVLYPSLFLRPLTRKPEVELALCRSYNRWLADVWSQGKGRLRWAAVLPLMSMDAALEERRELEASADLFVEAVDLADGVESHGSLPPDLDEP